MARGFFDSPAHRRCRSSTVTDRSGFEGACSSSRDLRCYVIDFHCHLDLYPNPSQVARECAARGIYVLSVTTTPSAWTGTAALSEGMPRIRTALGLHPQLANQRISELEIFERL